MSFCYYTRPLPGQHRYTGQPQHRGTRSSEEAVAALAARSGLTEPQMEAALLALSRYVIEETMDCWRIAPLLGYFGFQGTCGGSHQMPDFQPTFKNLAVDITLNFGKPADAYMRERFQSESVGHRPLVAPEVVRVTNMHNGQPNSYTSGKPMQIELADGKGSLNPALTSQGVYFTSASGVKVRATDYAYYKGSLIACTVPTGLTGAQQLSVAMWLNQSTRLGVWDQPLNAAPAQSDTVLVRNKRTREEKPKNGDKELALPS